MSIQMYLVTLVLCGELVSFSCCNPIAEVCKIAESAEVSNVTIKSI